MNRQLRCLFNKDCIPLLGPIIFVILFLLTWEVLVWWLSIPLYLIPSPTVISKTIIENFNTLVFDSMVTLVEAMLGFAVGTSTAFLIGGMFVQSKLIERSLSPLFVALQAVPLIAISPLLIIWFGNGMTSKIVMAAIACFFPMVINTAAGLKSVNQDALALMRVLSATNVQIFFKLRLPTALPYIFSGLKISATLSVIGAVVAELAGATQGIGFQVLMSSYRTDTPMLFSAVIFSALIGISFFKAVALLEGIVLKYGRR
jgi:NitT/TauT family transport system permease protein